MKYIKGKLRTLIFYVKWTSLFFLLGAICLNGLFIKQSFGGSQGVKMHQVTQEEIRLILREYILDRGPWEEGSVKIQGVSYFGLLPQLPLGYTYEVHSALTSSLLKLTPFTISFSLNEKVIKRLSVNAEIEIIEDVLISSRPLNRKQILGWSINLKNDLIFFIPGCHGIGDIGGNQVQSFFLGNGSGNQWINPMIHETPFSNIIFIS